MHLEGSRFPSEYSSPGTEISPTPAVAGERECPTCKTLRERLEKLSYCLAVAQQLADLRL